MYIVCTQCTPKHPVYEEPTAPYSTMEPIVDQYCDEPSESDQPVVDQYCDEPSESDRDTISTDEEIDDYHFSDYPSENSNDEMLAHGLDTGITDTQTESQSGKLIYPNARITNAASMLLIMTFAVIHKLSGEALKDLLALIDMHCSIPHALIQSLYKFKKYFSMLKHPIKRHHYCPSCCMPIDMQCSSCPNASCGEKFAANDKPFFIETPIIDQLKVLFNRQGFYGNLRHRFERQKKNLSGIEDIYDGTRYQFYMQSGEFLSQHHNISFIWNTDGIPVFKSSKYTIWPLYFAISELPPHKRWCSDNVILAGLWFGVKKPNMLTFLKPFTEGMSKLHSGIELYSPDIMGNFICRAMLLCGTCDLPAKAMVYNITQFNGKYGCSHCLQSGKTFRVGQRGNVHIYPYMQDNPIGPLRTNEQFHQHSLEAVESGKIVFGVKGPNWLSVAPKYNVIEGNVVDYMHCVLLGVTKMLLKLWFDTENSGEMWYCGTKVQIADSKLLQIRPPLNITRSPRSIQQHRSYWKASEYRAWLLFYSVPVMLNILPQDYLAHHMLLVEAIYLLLKDSIYPAELSKAELLIKHYCFKLQYYYGERYMSANVHHLLHLPQAVRNFGPLYCYSCFAYESLNGTLLKCIKGTQHVESQISETFSIKQSLPYIAQDHLLKGSEEEQFYHHIMSTKHHADREVCICGNHRSLGSINPTSELSDPVHQHALLEVTKSTKLGIFNRAAIGSCVFHSLQHTQTKKRNNYTVAYHHNDEIYFGEIMYFVTDFSSIFAVVAPFQDPQLVFPVDEITNCTLPHINTFAARSQRIIHVKELSVIHLCVTMNFTEHPSIIFVAQQPNDIEKD